ncbi:YceI family protein [Leptospira sp. WS39.C2]
MKNVFVTIFILILGTQLLAIEVSKKKIEFYVEHPAKNVTGVCNEIQMDQPKLRFSNGKYNLQAPFYIKIPILKISSGDSDRDAHIQEILGYPNTPIIEVKVESIQSSKENAEIYTIKGKITIHGMSKDFSTEANVNKLSGVDGLKVDGMVTLKFSEYALENPSLLFLKAKDDIQVKYLFVLK